ncbi:MAG: hypothetical protein OXE98_06800 [Hyphomicrobiales bacterium]|nr:hypothetical protein [Hyphomicrobiales bacterium]
MQYHEDLLLLSKRVLEQDGAKPSQASLRRSVSTVYYALFHSLAKAGADLLVGETNGSRSTHAWRQVYRGLEHGLARTACGRWEIMREFPLPIRDFGEFFVAMQQTRNIADYDPYKTFTKSSAEAYINRAKEVMKGFDEAPEKDRRAFCVHVLFKPRKEESRKI